MAGEGEAPRCSSASPPIPSDSPIVRDMLVVDLRGLSSSKAEQHRHDAQAVDPPLSHAPAYRTGTPIVSSSEVVGLGSDVNVSSSGTARSRLGMQVQDVQPVVVSGKDTSLSTVSNDPQASQSLKRRATALSNPSMASASPNEPPKKLQKTGRVESAGTFACLQSPPNADSSIVGDVATNGHAAPATKALPNIHVNGETVRKNSSQHELSHASHDGQQIARLENALEQTQERLASILYEQSKKYQADMERFESRLSRSYQLQLEEKEARLEARYHAFQTRALREFEAKLLATTEDSIVCASKSTCSETSKGIQESALKRLTATTEGLVQELATYKEHVSNHSELGRKLDRKLQAVTTRTSDASLQRFFSDCAVDSLTLLKESQTEELEQRLKRIQQELARRIDQTEISLRDFCKGLSHELQEQPNVNFNTDGGTLDVNATSAVNQIIPAELAKLILRVESVATEAQASLDATSKHDNWEKNMSKSIASHQQTLHALKRHTKNHHSLLAELSRKNKTAKNSTCQSLATPRPETSSREQLQSQSQLPARSPPVAEELEESQTTEAGTGLTTSFSLTTSHALPAATHTNTTPAYASIFASSLDPLPQGPSSGQWCNVEQYAALTTMPDTNSEATSVASAEPRYQFEYKYVGTVYQGLYLHLGSQILAYILVRTDVKAPKSKDNDSNGRRTVAFCSSCRTGVAESSWSETYKVNHWWVQHAHQQGSEGLIGRWLAFLMQRWRSKYPQESWTFDEETFKKLEPVPSKGTKPREWFTAAKKATTEGIQYNVDPLKSQEKTKQEEKTKHDETKEQCEPPFKASLVDVLFSVTYRSTEELRSMDSLKAWSAPDSTGDIMKLLGAASKVFNGLMADEGDDKRGTSQRIWFKEYRELLLRLLAYACLLSTSEKQDDRATWYSMIIQIAALYPNKTFLPLSTLSQMEQDAFKLAALSAEAMKGFEAEGITLIISLKGKALKVTVIITVEDSITSYVLVL